MAHLEKEVSYKYICVTEAIIIGNRDLLRENKNQSILSKFKLQDMDLTRAI